MVRDSKNYYNPRKGIAPRILFSGGQGNFTETWEESEAVIFARRAEELGVNREAILVETASSNTGENIKNSHRLLKEKGLLPKRIILVQKPFMERRYHTITAKIKYASGFLLCRTIATFTKQWPDGIDDVRVTSPQIPLDQYPNVHLSKEDILNTMVGDLQRIVEYPRLGFQSTHDVPEIVLTAMQSLIDMGYTKHLLQM